MSFVDSIFARFITVGALNSLLGLLSIYLAKILGSGEVTANAIGYGVGFLFSFLVNKRWTFRYMNSGVGVIVRFSLVMAVAYLGNLSVVLLLIRGFSVNGFIGQACGMPVYTIIGYVGCRWFAFAVRECTVSK